MGINRLGNPGIVPGAVPGVGPQVPLVPGTPGASVMPPFAPPAVSPTVPGADLTIPELVALPLVTVVGAQLVARIHAFPAPRSPFAMGPFAMSRPASSGINDALRRRLTYVGERPHAVSFRVRDAEVLFDTEAPLLSAARIYLLPDPLQRFPDTDVDEQTAVREALTKWPGHRDVVLRFYRPEFIQALNLD